MRSPRNLSISALIVLGVIFAGANVWFTAARSTIPLRLRGHVTHKQRLIEKKPGVDDVYIVTLNSNRNIQVDDPVFNAITEGQSIDKPAWSRTLEIEGSEFALSWSREFRGMIWAMPLTLATIVVLGLMALDRPRHNSDEQIDISGR